MRGLDPLRRHAVIADETAGIAAAATALGRDSSRARSLGAAAREEVERHFSRAEMTKRLAATVIADGSGR
jgi:glycosyltransferase involved in cell wall biosynthesis